jgi:hypothetical protein
MPLANKQPTYRLQEPTPVGDSTSPYQGQQIIHLNRISPTGVCSYRTTEAFPEDYLVAIAARSELLIKKGGLNFPQKIQPTLSPDHNLSFRMRLVPSPFPLPVPHPLPPLLRPAANG